MLNTPQGVTHLNGVTHGVLILEDDVKTGDDIAHQILRSEADGKARESGDRGAGRKSAAKFLNSGDKSHAPDHFIAGTVNASCERAGLLFAGLCRASLRGGGLDEEIACEMQEAVQNDCDEKNADKVEQIGNREIGYKGKEARHKLVAGRV